MDNKPYLLVAGDFRQTGGMDQANWALAQYLARSGREVHLAAFTAERTLASFPNVHLQPVPRHGSDFLGGFRLHRAGLESAVRIASRGGHVLVNGGNCPWPDVNWVHYVHRAFRPRSSSGVLRQLSLAGSHWVYRRDETAALRKARLVFANSKSTRRALIELLGVPERRIQMIYYGTAPQRFYPVPDAERAVLREWAGLANAGPVFAFAGSVNDLRKGFDCLFAAWAISRARTEAILLVAGADREADYWKARAAAEGLQDGIRFLGFRPDIESVFRICDVLVLPTRYDSFGLVVQEALCCGVPAVVSRHAGVAEIYPPELAPLLLDDPEDIGALAARLEHVAENLTAYRAAADRFAARLRTYTWDDMANRMVESIEA